MFTDVFGSSLALFRGIQEYIALDVNNITLVFDSGNIVNISGNIFLYPPQGHPILYKYVMGNNNDRGLCTAPSTMCNSSYTVVAYQCHAVD